MALLGRNKLGLVDGTCSKENFPESMWNHWERVNAIVLSWLMNSVSSGLLGGIIYASSAQAVWNDLHERFDKIDSSRSYNLHKETVTLSQGTASISAYFSKLNDLWKNLKPWFLLLGVDCPKSRNFVVHLQKLKLFQFLMGLNDSYSQATSQILLMSPMPRVNQAYAMVISDESQKSVVANAGLLGENPTSVTGQYDVNIGQVNNASWLGNCTFTKEQYDHIVQLLNKDNSASSPATPLANATGIPCALLASNSLQEWIIDTGATNHMVADLKLLNKASLVQTSQPKKELFSGRVKAIGREDSGLYILSRQTIPESDAISLATKETEANKEISSSNIDLWNKRLGHMSTTVLKKLLPVKTQDISARIDLCSICFCAK
ncbi:uncharacterized protein [Nicotiana tomentosiformis]|uniref:uncharacterized protein n=1 Tax=Nicotiana tomentosiformis TaxID=4098 RepID=UPI00388C5DC1